MIWVFNLLGYFLSAGATMSSYFVKISSALQFLCQYHWITTLSTRHRCRRKSPETRRTGGCLSSFSARSSMEQIADWRGHFYCQRGRVRRPHLIHSSDWAISLRDRNFSANWHHKLRFLLAHHGRRDVPGYVHRRHQPRPICLAWSYSFSHRLQHPSPCKSLTPSSFSSI